MRRAAPWLPILLMAGCGPISDTEREYFELREEERLQRDAFSRTLHTGADESEAIRLVKESAAEDGEGTTEQWIERERSEIEGQVLFPRWDVRRRGADKYEVRYTYTLLGDDHSIEKKGHAWTVDLVLKLVGPPRALQSADFTARARGRVSQQQRRQQREDRFSLE